MYKTSNGIEIYETVSDLIKKGITHIWDYRDRYYVRVKLDDFYDNGIWVVSKNSGLVSCENYIEFMLEIMDEATPVDIETFKNRLKRVS